MRAYRKRTAAVTLRLKHKSSAVEASGISPVSAGVTDIRSLKGMQELTAPNALQQTRIRRAGGGRQSSLAVLPGLEAAFLHVLEDDTAGSPMKAEVKWTNLTHQNIAARLTEHGFHVSVTVVKQLLKMH